MKNNKKELKTDTVNSKNFHVGIELELKMKVDSSEQEHDDDACTNSYREALESDGPRETLMNNFDMSRQQANRFESYFDFNQWVDDCMNEFSCDDSDCPYMHKNVDNQRDELKTELVMLTDNTSFKVVADSSVDCDDNEASAEVCWNYYASKDTVKDNKKILKFLKEKELTFDTSCGLHINLNNYLNIPQKSLIEVNQLDFLFNLVAPSRRKSSFCTASGLNGETKYSMIYNQGDRLEFRFFSPTLDHVKLNHYVSLANVIYRRLAGKDVKLSSKSVDYFLKKMVEVNKLNVNDAINTINAINSIKKAIKYKVKTKKTEMAAA